MLKSTDFVLNCISLQIDLKCSILFSHCNGQIQELSTVRGFLKEVFILRSKLRGATLFFTEFVLFASVKLLSPIFAENTLS